MNFHSSLWYSFLFSLSSCSFNFSFFNSSVRNYISLFIHKTLFLLLICLARWYLKLLVLRLPDASTRFVSLKLPVSLVRTFFFLSHFRRVFKISHSFFFVHEYNTRELGIVGRVTCLVSFSIARYRTDLDESLVTLRMGYCVLTIRVFIIHEKLSTSTEKCYRNLQTGQIYKSTTINCRCRYTNSRVPLIGAKRDIHTAAPWESSKLSPDRLRTCSVSVLHTHVLQYTENYMWTLIEQEYFML